MTLSDAWIDFVAGWCSGAISVLTCQPIDTILTRHQAGLTTAIEKASHSNHALASRSYHGIVGPSSVVFSVRHMTHSLTKSAGWKALWRGSSPMIGTVPLQNALLMGGYGVGQRYSELYAPNHRTAAVFVGGCTGGVVQSFLMSPVELVKVSQQCAGTPLIVASKDVVWNIHQWTAWRGLGATLLRDGIPHGVWFVAYEMTKQQLEQHLVAQRDESDPKALGSSSSSGSRAFIPLFSGAVAATVAWAVGYPADLIKTRIQSASASAAAATTTTHRHRGILDTARILIREANGNVLAGLYKGFGLKLLRAVPASMIGFTIYEMAKSGLAAEGWR
ncbi:hypothetical protein ACA910_017559 [Epithemia clementina (nom. ined.)]